MSYKRKQVKRDAAEPAIVDALQAAGCLVYRELLVDLLIHRPEWGAGWFRCQEVKTPGEPKHARNRCKGQDEFIAATGTPIVKTEYEALTEALKP
jgi:hypothetical protein